MTNLIDNRRGSSSPRQSPSSVDAQELDIAARGRSIIESIDLLQGKLNEFNHQFSELVPRQGSPLIDRIPPRGVELWVDFWGTVRKQVEVINKQFWQLSRDLSRMLTGRAPGNQSPSTDQRQRIPSQVSPTQSLLYSSQSVVSEEDQIASVSKRFQDFYDNMSVVLGEQQRKMDSMNRIASFQATQSEVNKMADQVNLIDDQDDQTTRDELNRNVALRQQIRQEITMFGSIFDLIGAFIQRLRESTTNMVRDVVRPGSTNNNNNDPVTPGPSVKPQVDKLLDETINSQRNINGQAKPVLLPSDRLPIQTQQG